MAMGGRGLPPCPTTPLLFLCLLLLLNVIEEGKVAAAALLSSSEVEANALLEFKDSLSKSNAGALPSWTTGSTPCSGNHTSWNGVICVNDNVFGLQLENMSLSGPLDLSPLAGLPGLRTLSFFNNSFVGPMPDIRRLGPLKALYLSMNQLSGELPDGLFAATRSLKRVHLWDNEFTGPMPTSLRGLTKLIELRLDSNGFQGRIPDLSQHSLAILNVSYNDLAGPIPRGLSKMPADSFEGNDDLCGPPLAVACPSKSSSNKRLVAIIVIVVAAVALAILVLMLAVIRRRSRETLGRPSSSKAAYGSKSNNSLEAADKIEKGSAAAGEVYHHSSNSGSGGGKKGSGAGGGKDMEHGRLAFVKEGRRDRFELQDLLRASAEVLGSGNFGSSYKAALMDGAGGHSNNSEAGAVVVVKRFKEMNGVGKEDFQEHMRRLGRLSHPNLLPLVAYYYRKEEKLLITDYIPNGSLAHMLHGNRGSNIPPLDWPTRLKIIKGVARGLAYLYEELPMLSLPHGHLKSSNVLVDDSYEPLLTDYALVPVMNKSHASQVMVAYKSPEVTNHGRPSKKSDVWSLGILILEVLTGKFPATYLHQGNKGGTDLAAWVNSVVRQEWTGEVFDAEMKGTNKGQGEMLKLLHIGLACCDPDADKRWEMKVVLQKIEDLNDYSDDDHEEGDTSDSFVMSDVEMHSSRDNISFS